MDHSDFDHSRPNLLYGYGYTERYESISTQTIVESYLERGEHNVLVVDWSDYSKGNYLLEAIRNSYKVGDIIAQKLLEMDNHGIKIESFHLLGHSLGGQMVGFIGRSVIKHSNGKKKIKRITALGKTLFKNMFLMTVESINCRPSWSVLLWICKIK